MTRRRFDVELDDPDAVLREVEATGPALVASAAIADEPAWRALPVREAETVDRAAAVERLLIWARDAGATWDGIAFAVEDGQVSVRAARDLRAHDAILALPRRMMIVDNELGGSASGQPASAEPAATLAAWLPLEARAPGSRWRAYLDALPARLDELPMFHGADELGLLAGTAAHELARELQCDIHASYAALPTELRARLSLADFAWGYAQVTSRAFHAPGTLDHRVAMLPLVDLFDHGLDDTTWTYDPFEGFVIRTVRDFRAGDAVRQSYGDRSNAHLAVYFGFALPGNPTDEAALRFARPADPAIEAAAHLLWGLPLGAPALLRVGAVFDDRFHRALSLARLHASQPADRARAIALGLGIYGDLPWISLAHEAAALAQLAEAARRSLAVLDAAPPATDRSWDRRCAVVRDGERAVLARLIACAEQAPRELEGGAPPDAPALLRDYLRAIADERAAFARQGDLERQLRQR